MKTRPFNIDEAKAGAKVVNKAGNPVRLVCFDGESYYSGKHQQIIDSMARTYSADGIFNHNDWSDGSCDLLLVSEPKLRPWRAGEVPLGAILRDKIYTDSKGILAAVLPDSREIISPIFNEKSPNFETEGFSFEFVLKTYEWKWPQEPDTAWKPCGVKE